MPEVFGARYGATAPTGLLPAAGHSAAPSVGVLLEGRRVLACQALVRVAVLARLSELAYGKPGIPPAGYTDITHNAEALSVLHLAPGMFADLASHFRARAFSCQQNGTAHYVVAFAGTDPYNLDDYATDAEHALGFETKQYKAAAYIGRRLTLVPQEIPVVLTGHSLGGGLATAAALASGRPAVIFNAAGTSPTKAQLGVRPPSIDAYSVSGDPLTFLQTKMRVAFALSAFIGMPGFVADITLLTGDPLGHVLPSAYGRSITLQDYPVPGQSFMTAIKDRHGIARVERDIDQARIVLQCR